MEFAKLSAPSLKDLFVQQLQGMIVRRAAHGYTASA